MDAALLIDSLVRQTTVLIAEVATAGGNRPRLAHVADEVFRNLISELRSQGVSNKCIADMFGLTLRTYHKKIARLWRARPREAGSSARIFTASLVSARRCARRRS